VLRLRLTAIVMAGTTGVTATPHSDSDGGDDWWPGIDDLDLGQEAEHNLDT